MTVCKYASVAEFTSGPEEGERFAQAGKMDATGKFVQLGGPDKDFDGMRRLEWERVAVFDLPHEMTKAEVKQWLQEEEPEEVYTAMEGENNGD